MISRSLQPNTALSITTLIFMCKSARHRKANYMVFIFFSFIMMCVSCYIYFDIYFFYSYNFKIFLCYVIFFIVINIIIFIYLLLLLLLLLLNQKNTCIKASFFFQQLFCNFLVHAYLSFISFSNGVEKLGKLYRLLV